MFGLFAVVFVARTYHIHCFASFCETCAFVAVANFIRAEAGLMKLGMLIEGNLCL